MIPSDKDRWYSRPPSNASLGMGYGYSAGAVGTGGGNNVSGVWIPIQVDSSGFLLVNPQPSTYQYNSIFTSLTGSQVTIPAGAIDWSITTQSGTAFVNGAPTFSPSVLAGGLSAGRLASPITVGTTGGRVLVVYDI